MALFTETEVRARAHQSIANYKLAKKAYVARKAGDILVESAGSFSEAVAYDIFLSHTIKDGELVLGIKGILEDLQYVVYVDWIEDPQLDRTKVTAGTSPRKRPCFRPTRVLAEHLAEVNRIWLK